ncbi:MAG: hypothetical protein E7220_05905 [Clostridiales bacterium]|nr:hypothetical protein [Clostridiales bacterium]
MKRELEHFRIGSSYGGNQDWFRTFMMRIGGCGAETACDSSLYFALHRGIEGIYPYDLSELSKHAYIDFAHHMEKYLWPRMSGIDRLDIYIDGYSAYLRDRGIEGLSMTEFGGHEPYEKAAEVLACQIDNGYPVPTLVLNHRDRAMRDYVWHWFLINGYDRNDDTGDMLAKAVTYSGYQWIDLKRLWTTGFENKGGFVLYELI